MVDAIFWIVIAVAGLMGSVGFVVVARAVANSMTGSTLSADRLNERMIQFVDVLETGLLTVKDDVGHTKNHVAAIGKDIRANHETTLAFLHLLTDLYETLMVDELGVTKAKPIIQRLRELQPQ